MKLNDDQINDMVSRFLSWQLPKNFAPDGGISFQREYQGFDNYTYPNKPTGTNLFTFEQAKEMVLHMVEQNG